MKDLRKQAEASSAKKAAAITGGKFKPGLSARGYAAGGSVHSDAAQDRAMIERAVKPEALTGRKDGGRAPDGSKKASGTQVNIIITGGPGGAPGAAAQQGPMPMPVPVPQGGGGTPPLGGSAGPIMRKRGGGV